MIKWLVKLIQKEARRFQQNDSVRYFTQPRKGKGKGIVLTPSFRPGRIVDYDSSLRRYRVVDDGDQQEILVHPRNLVHNTTSLSDVGIGNDNTNSIIEPSMNPPDSKLVARFKGQVRV